MKKQPANFETLQRNYQEGLDFRVNVTRRRSGAAVLAPHGGNIEPGTSELARAIARQEHTFYEFAGLRATGNRALHIPSVDFDEPRAQAVLESSLRVVIVHGCHGQTEVVFVGGPPSSFKDRIVDNLERSGFFVDDHPEYRGRHPQNLCNRVGVGCGVQLEVTSALRRRLFQSVRLIDFRLDHPLLGCFSLAVREAIEEELNRLNRVRER